MYSTIVIIVTDPSDAIKIEPKVSHNADTKRLFVFIGQKPTVDDLRWITPDDMYLILENAIDLGDNAYKMAIRAGVLYTTSNAFIFCNANNIPNDGVITQLIKKATQKISDQDIGLFTEDSAIAINREYILFSGFDTLYIDFLNTLQQNPKINPIQIAQAMSGQPVSEDIAIAAINELCPLEHVYSEQSIPNSSFWNKAIKSTESKQPKSILFCQEVAPDLISIARTKIASDGIVIIELDNNQPIPTGTTPFQTFRTTTGKTILIYTKEK